MTNVVELEVNTRLPIPAKKVLQKAIEADIPDVVLIGWDKDGKSYFASSMSLKKDILWLLESAKKELME